MTSVEDDLRTGQRAVSQSVGQISLRFQGHFRCWRSGGKRQNFKKSFRPRRRQMSWHPSAWFTDNEVVGRGGGQGGGDGSKPPTPSTECKTLNSASCTGNSWWGDRLLHRCYLPRSTLCPCTASRLNSVKLLLHILKRKRHPTTQQQQKKKKSSNPI